MHVEVALVSRGKDMSVALSSLIAQDYAAPLHLVLAQLPNARDGLLLDTLRRIGWPISLHLQKNPGIGSARVEVADHCAGDVLVSLDDDAVLYPQDALGRLAAAAQEHSFACPIIRYVSNFSDAVAIPHHEEIWEQVDEDDPRVRRAVEMNGRDWLRVFELGHDQKTTDIGGTAFAVRLSRYREVVGGLAGWSKAGGEDRWLAKQLVDRYGPGVVLSGAYAYHVGMFSLQEWGFDVVGHRLCREDPDEFRKYAQ
jgi:glycosyltransferase involved in cell wall biosynthesis